MRRIPSFVYGHVLGAMLMGVAAGAVLDARAVAVFSGIMGVSALASAFVCRYWPGFTGPGWQLWIMGAITNPAFIVTTFFTLQDYDCLVGRKTGWDCMFTELGPVVMIACFGPPLIGVAVRWLARLGAKARA